MAGPRVRVRRGRRAKLPGAHFRRHSFEKRHGALYRTNQLLVRLIEEDGVVGLVGYVSNILACMRIEAFKAMRKLTGILYMC